MNAPDTRTLLERWHDRDGVIVTSEAPAWMREKPKRREAAPRNSCIRCAKPVSNGRRGELNTIDPEHLFCTLRCAASYGVRFATMIAKKGTP